ncbi:nucleoside triphosphate pyrophosphohydrolase [Dongshaea marina]|uniref:nucleoside triphosphate pyrophosphohydrolase n=1 Tax=Dongshaea marina TaxID=2047966 RepID=UPI000D3EDE25|nr:nucleoside triphosphate pyrophosphohydrolase [Dongshaea marina]
MTEKTYTLNDLLDVMSTLRDPDKGCAWDRKQTFATIVPHTLEEAYEVAETIEQQDFAALPGELGDLLFQVVFYSQLAKEQQLFEFEDVVNQVTQKLIRRHPHVFAGVSFADEQAMKRNWEQEKAKERASKSGEAGSVLDDIPTAMPALTRANKIQKRCAGVGFDWNELAPVVAKLHEEIDEVMAEVNAPEPDQQKVTEEVGDLLFACVNLVRHLKQDPEQALRQANDKFCRRFREVEQRVHRQGQQLTDCSLEQLDQIWDQVKRAES